MGSGQDSLKKNCILCGMDCADHPRIKDRGGRYFCPKCYETAKRLQEVLRQDSAVDMPANQNADETHSNQSAITDPGETLADESTIMDVEETGFDMEGTGSDGSSILSPEEFLAEESAKMKTVEIISQKTIDTEPERPATFLNSIFPAIPCLRCGDTLPENATACVSCGCPRPGTPHIKSDAECRAERVEARAMRSWNYVRRPSYLFCSLAGSMTALAVYAHYNEDLSIFYILVVILITLLVGTSLIRDACRADWRYAVRSLFIPGYAFWYVFMVSRNRFLRSAFCANCITILLIPLASTRLLFPGYS